MFFKHALMPANVIIKSDERRAQESAMLRAFGGGHEGNSAAQNREYAEEINARMNDVKREVGMSPYIFETQERIATMGNMRRYGAPGNPETDEGREQRSGLIILQRSKDLMKYLYTSFVKYPRSEKLGFVADYKKCLFQFLILIITAQKKYFKKTTLQDADVQLELLRMFNDLSYDMKFVDEKRYILVSEKLCEIGRLLGGWIRSQKETSTNTGK